MYFLSVKKPRDKKKKLNGLKDDEYTTNFSARRSNCHNVYWVQLHHLLLIVTLLKENGSMLNNSNQCREIPELSMLKEIDISDSDQYSNKESVRIRSMNYYNYKERQSTNLAGYSLAF